MFYKNILRWIIYRKVLLKLKSRGKNIIFSKGGVVKCPNELEIGDNVFISRNFHISARSMKIGNNVMIGPNFLAECDDHVFNLVGVSMFSVREVREIAPIKIENDVWIGGNVTLLKGVTVNEGCVIGAGSVVTKTMPPYSICVGVPCRPFKLRFDEDKIDEHLDKVGSHLSGDYVRSQWKEFGLIG